MIEEFEKIKKTVMDFCMKSESIKVAETTDSLGNPCLEWQTEVVLELLGNQGGRGPEKRLSRQHIPVQFDVSFDETKKKLLFFMQWGKVEPAHWEASQAEIQQELQKEANVQVRYYNDRQVIELFILYPLHEFDFEFVYEEVVSFFGIANGLIFKNANMA